MMDGCGPQPSIMVQAQQSPARGEQDEDKPSELSEDAKRLARLVHEEEARRKPRQSSH
jgi:hypothetical protein